MAGAGIVLTMVVAGLIQSVPIMGMPDGDTPYSKVPEQKMQAFAGCIAVDQPSSGRALLRKDDYATLNAGVRSIVAGAGRCLTKSGLRFPPLLLVGALSEYWVVRDVPPERFAAAVAYRPGEPDLVMRVRDEGVAACLVRAMPDAVRSVFRTSPGSAGEADALRPIIANLPECVADHETSRFNRAGLRALLGMASYRLAGLGLHARDGAMK